MDSPDGVPAWLEPFFWDVRLQDLNTRDNDVFIIERLLNEGDQDTLRWLFEVYNEKRINDAIITGRDLSPKTARCWQNYFDLQEDQMRCFGPRSTSPGRTF